MRLSKTFEKLAKSSKLDENTQTSAVKFQWNLINVNNNRFPNSRPQIKLPQTNKSSKMEKPKECFN
jgi:hypothetical protein